MTIKEKIFLNLGLDAAKDFLSNWMSMFISAATNDLHPLWVTKAQFSANPN